MHYQKTTEQDMREICAWRYSEPYSIYNQPPFEEQQQAGRGFANPKNHLFSFFEEDRLVGYVNLYPEESEVFFGIGVRPDCCGQGYGQQIIKAAVRLSFQLFAGKPLYLEVRSWNRRAIRCYEKAGFQPDGPLFEQTTPIGQGTFLRMIYHHA